MKKLLTAILSAACICSCCKSNDTINVIPQPQNVRLCDSGSLDLKGACVNIDPAFEELATDYALRFGDVLQKASGSAGTAEIRFIADKRLEKEEYGIKVNAKGIQVRASGLNGVIYAIQTIKQLLPVEIYSGEDAADKDWNIPYMTVSDKPRFAYRGMHLDPCRHFFSVEETKRFIDIMEIHKMNTLHWHLTEDQGWRVEIKKYPRLTEVGSMRRETIIGHTKEYDGTPYGGYYTQEEIKDVVAYAAARGITIIPEVDLPGHMQAALAAYPELGCTGGPYEVWCKWGVSENVLCVGKEEVFTFLEDVISELCELFPGEYFHIGGDECPKTRWHDCPLCQAKIAELGIVGNEKFTPEDFLQSYVTKRMEDFLTTKGRKIIGWDEILQGEVSPNATVMSWRGVQGGITASQMGHDVIMTPNIYCYFDYCQSHDADREPISIGGYLPVDKVYLFEPCTDMTKEQAAHIIGVQANVWTEYIATPEHLEYMILPREAALSEVQWCQSGRKDWNRFHADLERMCAIYEQRGYNYAKHALDPDFGSIKPKEKVANKAKGKKVESLTDPHPSYTLHAPAELFDGVLGYDYFGSGDWIGYFGKPLDVVVRMGCTPFHAVTFSTLVGKPDYILNLTGCRISVSKDGKTYSEIACEEYKTDGPQDPDETRCYRVEFPETRAKFLKIEAWTDEGLPQWHAGAGSTPFLFLDEVIVE